MNRYNLGCISVFNFYHKFKIPNAFIHCKYNLTRQGDEDKIRYLYIKGATSWSSCNYGISGTFRQH